MAEPKQGHKEEEYLSKDDINRDLSEEKTDLQQ